MALSTPSCKPQSWSLAFRLFTSTNFITVCLLLLISTSSYGQDSSQSPSDLATDNSISESRSETSPPLAQELQQSPPVNPNSTTVAPLRISSNRKDEICRRQRQKMVVQRDNCEDVVIDVFGCGGLCESETVVQTGSPPTRSNCRCCSANSYKILPRTIEFTNCTFTIDPAKPPTRTIYVGRKLVCGCIACEQSFGIGNTRLR